VNTDQSLMPGYDAAEVTKRVSAAWAFRLGFLPWPRFLIRCPTCYAADAQLQRISFGKHPGTIPGRADVSIKCCRCSYLFVFGVPVSEEVYRQAVKPDGSRSWDWREVQMRLQSEGAE